MSLEKITNAILAEAEKEKDDLLIKAKEEADRILKEAKAKAQEITDASERDGQEEREKIIDGRNSVINVEIRKITLQKKQEVLRETFEKAGVDFEEHKRDLQQEVAKILF